MIQYDKPCLFLKCEVGRSCARYQPKRLADGSAKPIAVPHVTVHTVCTVYYTVYAHVHRLLYYGYRTIRVHAQGDLCGICRTMCVHVQKRL